MQKPRKQRKSLNGEIAMPRDIIVGYATSEDSTWLPWPKKVDDTVPTDTELKELQHSKRRHPQRVELQRTHVGESKYVFILLHSFLTQSARQWDCINGWNDSKK